jgi:hypothetical protein
MADTNSSAYWIKSLIEALRGGSNPERVVQRYGTYNPPPKTSDGTLGALPYEGMQDQAYNDYIKRNPGMSKSYMRWVEEGE